MGVRLLIAEMSHLCPQDNRGLCPEFSPIITERERLLFLLCLQNTFTAGNSKWKKKKNITRERKLPPDSLELCVLRVILQIPDLGLTSGDAGPTRSGPLLQADAPAGPTPGRAPDALAPESPIPQEAGVFTPFLGKQTEAQRGETCPSSHRQQRRDRGSPRSPSWRRLAGRAPPSRPPVSSGAPNGGKAADGLGIFSCLSPAARPQPQRLWE